MIVIVVIVVLLVFLVISLFVRRHGESLNTKPDWQRTEEIFNDPSTNRVMRVWVDRSGDRHYVPEPKPRTG